MTQEIIVSLVIEMGTREITGAIPIEATAQNILEDAQRTFKEEEFEVLFVGCNISNIQGLPANCRCLDICTTGYYGWKNAGARAARGKYVIFWDSDTRPERGYLKRAVDLLEKNPSWSGLTGASRYDETSYLARFNSILSFGFLHQDQAPKIPMGHNIVIRKSQFPIYPFGPYEGRVGGSSYLSSYAVKQGTPLKHFPALLMHHEDMSYSIKALMEQHLREIFIGMNHRKHASKWVALGLGAGNICLIPLRRLRRLALFGKKFNFGFFQSLIALPLVALYTIIDVIVFVALALIPPLLDKWLDFQLMRKGEGVYEAFDG